ncbi:mitochondrial ribosomal protein MRP51 [Aspergillus californicus]
MATTRLSPTANLLRKSRLFALPQALIPPPDSLNSRNITDSDTATLPHPVRASIVTPASSLSRGDWGLKRPLPAKSTSESSSRPVVRVIAHDTFEHVTDFESAADHTMTLEKFQELNMPMSLPERVNYQARDIPPHHSPFELKYDNTETSASLNETGARQFRHSGPWLGGLTQAEFDVYLKKIQRDTPDILRKLRARLVVTRNAERKKRAQDNGEDLENLEPVEITDADFQSYLKLLRADRKAMGLVVFDLLDLPSAPAVPSSELGTNYFASPATNLSSPEYALGGPPRTHPSAGLSYSRTHSLLYNHPKYGPQTHQRPVEARILRPKGKFRGRTSKAIAGIGGIAVEDVNSVAFSEPNPPAGMAAFDATIPGGGKYHVTPIRASIDSKGRIQLASHRVGASTKTAYGIEDPVKPAFTTRANPREQFRESQRSVPRLDRARMNSPRWHGQNASQKPERKVEDVASNIRKSLGV